MSSKKKQKLWKWCQNANRASFRLLESFKVWLITARPHEWERMRVGRINRKDFTFFFWELSIVSSTVYSIHRLCLPPHHSVQLFACTDIVSRFSLEKVKYYVNAEMGLTKTVCMQRPCVSEDVVCSCSDCSFLKKKTKHFNHRLSLPFLFSALIASSCIQVNLSLAK